MKIVAEIGSNWKSLDDLRNAIVLAKNIGADAAKLQLYTHEELYGFHGAMAGEMPREWIKPLAEKAHACGIEFMCTAFSVSGLRYIDPYIQTHKLASSEMCHIDMLAELRKLKKPVLVSTGGQTEADVRAVAKLFGTQATFLYCEAAYPAQHIDVRKMPRLGAIVSACGGNSAVGFSDHSTDVYTTPMAAAVEGAVVLEKHFNPFDYTDTPDAGHSLNTDDFRAMIRALRGEDSVVWRPTRAEYPMLMRHKRRLIVTKPVAPGDMLVFNENFGVYRAKADDPYGAHPATAHQANGKVSLVARKPGDGLSLKDIE